MLNIKPSLFGLNNTNRDFAKKEAWGKNQFNSSFPASLCCYLDSKNIKANYLSILAGKFGLQQISIQDIFNISPADEDIYFAFESQHSPYQKYVLGSLPRTDLVVQKKSTGECLSGLEVKLTALPDNTTCELTEKLYGSEIVVRPDTIVYLACSIALSLSSKLGDYIPDVDIENWQEPSCVLVEIEKILKSIYMIAVEIEKTQTAFLLQPIWKTLGKSSELSENCLDLFVWSNAGFTYFISEIANNDPKAISITRQTRTAIWLYKMLYDIKKNGKFDHKRIIDDLSYNTKNDKAFASSGSITNRYMISNRLLKPIISKQEIKEIILGGGQNLLSPERRFDAILFNSPGLF